MPRTRNHTANALASQILFIEAVPFDVTVFPPLPDMKIQTGQRPFATETPSAQSLNIDSL
jgi:hypothetical protein